MTTPENLAHQAPEKISLLKKLIEFLFRHKQWKAKKEIEKRAKEGEEAHRKSLSYETTEKWEEEERKREREEKDRAYHQAKSAEIEKLEAGLARSQRAAEVKRKLDSVFKHPENQPHGSAYLIDTIQKDSNVQAALKDLIEGSSSAAEVIESFISKETELHGSARELIQQTQLLAYEAGKISQATLDGLKPLFEAIGDRVNELLWDEREMSEKALRARGGRGFITYSDLLAEDSKRIVLTSEQNKTLSQVVKDEDEKINWKDTKEKWGKAVEELITSQGAVTPEEKDRAQWVAVSKTPSSQQVIKQLVAPIDRIWGEVERREAKGQLTTDDLIDYSRKIWEQESRVIPRDVPPGSDDYRRVVQELGRYTEGKIQILTEKLKERLREERPVLKTGITNVEDFLEEMNHRKGRLGDLLQRNPEMYKLFLSVDKEGKGRKFRDRVFLAIHSAVLSDRRNSSNDNFGLYERSDFTAFIDLIRKGLGNLVVKETGKPLGQTWSDRYNNLSNTIRQCRDVDFWASQPGANFDNFNKSLGMFQNEYVKEAFNIPAVNAAFRAYETTLRSIRACNDGYIPPALIEYDATTSRSFWDDMSLAMLEQMITMGSVPDVKREEISGVPKRDPDGHSVVMDFENVLKLTELSQEEKLMYMTLAKGMGIATARYLEIISASRCPGSDSPEFGMDQFHSMPYENLVKALNYFNTYIEKWKMGSYKYFYLLNQLVPDEERIKTTPNDPTEAIRAYMAYQDGTFEEKYGSEAKRFIDLTNFSNISSAIGLNTLWRQYDTTLSWSDRMREMLGGPTQLALSRKYTEEKVKDFLIVDKYKEQYRQEVVRRNQEKGLSLPTSGSGFDKLWKDYGINKYARRIEKEWEKLTGRKLEAVRREIKRGFSHTPLYHETKHLIDSYQKAFKARVWVEMAMRNPLVVAHSLKVDVPLVAIEGEKKMSLHRMLVQDILGIPPEDTTFGEEYGKSAKWKTPTKRQEEYMINVLTLEGDLAAVREKAINEGRDLTQADFKEVIKDEARRQHALEYWKKVREVILGTSDIAEAKRLYDKFGLVLMENGQYYQWDHQKIHQIENTLKSLERKYGERVTTIKSQEKKDISIPFFLKKAVEMEPERILGTDDMALGKMDLLNLGSRQLIRRGGDIASHNLGGEAVVKYLVDGLLPKPDKHELAKLLKEIRNAYSGDMIEYGWDVAANFAYMTDRLYTWDWSRLGSTAQLDIWGTRRNVDAWLANGRREFWDVLEHADVLPPHRHFHYYSHIGEEKYNIHDMRKMCHAENVDVWREIVSLGILLAIAITIYRGFTAKSEEEEGAGAHH